MPDTVQSLLPTEPELLEESAARALLDTAYAKPQPGAVAKDIGRIDQHLRHFISLSPFCAMATSDGDGRMDVTPRGDKPGFVKVLDERTLALPDRPGNNRLDSLHNIVRNPAPRRFAAAGCGIRQHMWREAPCRR
jgi:predicted pyridoxine 5'-phosphate oxidase superfamily flavin-nucleotide-binding protein